MTVTEAIVAKLRHLSPGDQQKVLELVSSLPAAEPDQAATGMKGGEERSPPSIWRKLREIGEASERMPCSLPADLAANHDFYLHALPKRS
jgi:hypothetical protein